MAIVSDSWGYCVHLPCTDSTRMKCVWSSVCPDPVDKYLEETSVRYISPRGAMKSRENAPRRMTGGCAHASSILITVRQSGRQRFGKNVCLTTLSPMSCADRTLCWAISDESSSFCTERRVEEKPFLIRLQREANLWYE